MKTAQTGQYLRPGLVLIIFLLMLGCSTERLEHISTPKNIIALDSGKALVEGLAACGFCHGKTPTPDSPLSGGQSYTDLFGEKTVPNITPAANALGSWTNEELLRYFRSGLDGDNEQLSQAPHRGMEWMADEDIFAVIAYLRSVPAVTVAEAHSAPLTFIDRNTNGFFEGRREVNGFVPAVQKKSSVRYGQYLVEHVAACGRCHNSPNSIISTSEFLKGGTEIVNASGEKLAPNISNDAAEGIGSWSAAQIVSFLQTGKKPNGAKVDSRFCPLGFYRNASEEDLESIAKFLKTVSAE